MHVFHAITPPDKLSLWPPNPAHERNVLSAAITLTKEGSRQLLTEQTLPQLPPSPLPPSSPSTQADDGTWPARAARGLLLLAEEGPPARATVRFGLFYFIIPPSSIFHAGPPKMTKVNHSRGQKFSGSDFV